MKNIQSKMKALECSQHYTAIFRPARADNSGVGGGIWPKFELILAFMQLNLGLVQDFMVVLVTSKMKKIKSKMKALECSQHYTAIFQMRKGR